MCPHLLFQPVIENEKLSKEASNEDLITNANNDQDATHQSTTFIHDLISYVSHPDNKMRMNVCTLIGQFINSALIDSDGNYDQWLNKMLVLSFRGSSTQVTRAFNSLRLEQLIDHLMRFIKLDNQKVTNNICKRYALSSLHAFLPNLVNTKYASLALEIIVNIMHLRHSNYNLVKCELVDLIASVDFKAIVYIEHLLSSNEASSNKTNESFEEEVKRSPTAPFLVRQTQERLVEEVFLYLLGSEDTKVYSMCYLISIDY